MVKTKMSRCCASGVGTSRQPPRCLDAVPLTLSAGLPHRLPDSVCPAAVLQHVLRPPQQRGETNAAVHRPLAPPAAFPTHSSSPSSRARHFCSPAQFTANEWRGRRRARTCTYLRAPHLDGHGKERTDAERGRKGRSRARLCFLKPPHRSPFLDKPHDGREAGGVMATREL